jgi:hypothetical protein
VERKLVGRWRCRPALGCESSPRRHCSLGAAVGRWVRPDRLISRVTFRVALISIQGMTIGLAGVSLSNAMLLSSIQG